MNEDVNIIHVIKKIMDVFKPRNREEFAGAAEATGRIVAAIISTTKKEVTL